MTTTPGEPVRDEDIETVGAAPGPADADGTDAGGTADADGTDAGGTADADGADAGGPAEPSDSGDVDGTDG